MSPKKDSKDKNAKSEKDPSNNESESKGSWRDLLENWRQFLGIPFILLFKFGERYSFYSFYVILTLYLREALEFKDDITAVIFHTFMMLVYLMPIVGALMADSYITKFWTILSMAIIYVLGKAFVVTGSSMMGMTAMKAISLLGLLMIAVAEGALKPCSSAFGGDQFEDHQHKHRRKYFALYFFVIYCSHSLAALLTPIFRKDVHCSGRNTCYPLAFGIAVVFSVLGTTAFIIGKPFYRNASIQEGMLVQVLKCIVYAWSEKLKNKDETKDHWLDYAEGQFDESLISDLKALFHVLQIYIPLPIFITLLHQVASTWVLQGRKMDGEIRGYRITPDQMVILQPILMVIITPILEMAIYPFLIKVRFLKTQLQKIGAACVLNGLAFFIAGFVQLSIEADLAPEPKRGYGELLVINNSPCTLTVTRGDNLTIPGYNSSSVKDLPLNEQRIWNITPSACAAVGGRDRSFKLIDKFEVIMLTQEIKTLGITIKKDDRKKSENLNPRVKVAYRYSVMDSVMLFRGIHNYTIPSLHERIDLTEYYEMEPGDYEIYHENKLIGGEPERVGEGRFRIGGSYIFVFYENRRTNSSHWFIINTVKWNTVHILFQLPQYIFVATAEVMFAITGVAFAYAEAPVSMKAVVHGCWFLNYAFGNALFLILKSFIHLLKDSTGFFIFGILMFIGMAIFVAVSMFYTYIHDENKLVDEVSKDEEQ